ncbi:MAG: hypothetical protein GY866_39710 [Proteobacteria bacterium]|nr:hypothetical protein [Pseudomonadota bacterium]
MPAFLKKKSQTDELIRIWKATLLVEEAMQKTLTPVLPEVAKHEGRTYFKTTLPDQKDRDLLAFFLRANEDISIEINGELIPFLLYLSRQDSLSKKYRQPIEHDFLVGFPAFYYKDRFGKEKLTTLFKFPLIGLDYPLIAEHEAAGFQTTHLPDGNTVTLSQETFDENEAGTSYWLDELLLEEELGILDEEILDFRKICFENNFSAIGFLAEFCKRLLKYKEIESHDQNPERIFTHLIKALKNNLLNAVSFSQNRQPIRIFPFGLVYELESNQPTRQLQNDLSDVIDQGLLQTLKKKHPARYYLFGKNDENQLKSSIAAQYTSLVLTESQEFAIKAAQKRLFTVVKGPPGTGKTHVIRNLLAERLVRFVEQLRAPDDRFDDLRWITLVTSTNNRAVDNAFEGMEVDGLLPANLRVGSRIVLSGTTSVFLKGYYDDLSQKIGYQNIKSFFAHRKTLNKILNRKQNASDSENAVELAGKRHQAYIAARNVLDAWVGCNREKILKVVKSIIDDIEERRGLRSLKKPKNLHLLLTAFPMIGCTLLSLRNFFPMEENAIGMAIVDEAGQCSPSYLLPALLRSRRSVVIGDTMQLEPIAKLRTEDIETLRKNRDIQITAETCRFFSSTTENLRSAHHIAIESCREVLELKDHFRCRDKIIQISQELCGYDLNVLTASPSTNSTGWKELHYLDVEGREKRYGSSWINEQEIDKLMALAKTIRDYGVPCGEIAILTPFKGQLNHIILALRKERLPFSSGENSRENIDAISTGTVHRFQGGERKFVLFSHVISQGEPRFLNARVNLLNVAISRAQSHFIFVGSLTALKRGSYTALLREHLLAYGEPIRL